jgi:PncC family amidohydrolase
MEREIAKILKRKKLTISVAESCSGGLLSNKLTNISGSSEYFIGGVVAYNNSTKIKILKVPKELLKKYGAVSEEVAKKMAENVRKITNTDIGISTTGIAGPTGGTKEKPVGLVFIGISDEKRTIVEKFNFKGKRLEIKEKTAISSLKLLKKFLRE